MRFLPALVLLLSGPRAEPFRIVILPDTQWSTCKWPEQVMSQTRWIAENAAALNIKYVLHVGDMVQNGPVEEEWKRFDDAMRVLDGKVPYILAVGNHDFDKISGPRSTQLFNKYFPASRFDKQASFGGAFPEGTNDNSYHAFEAGGLKWLVVALAFSPTEQERRWAREVIAKHPGHHAILLTHHYLTHKGRDVPGELMWNDIVKPSPNASIVVCGHLSTVHFVSEAEGGRKVYEMLFDWQNDKEAEPNSYLSILEIDPDGKRMTVKTYSPHFKKYKTDARAQFEFENVRFARD